MNLRKAKNLIHYYWIKRRIGEYEQIDGWLTKSEAVGLHTVASLLPSDAVVVEIGTWKGKSTYCIAKGLKSGKIYSVDPFDASGEEDSAVVYEQRRGNSSLLEQFETRMKLLNVYEKITPMKGLSNQFVGKFNSIDFLFIDGDHSIQGCDFDFVNYAPFLKKGGYLAFHDYYADRDELGPTWVVKNRVLRSEDYKFINLYDTLWVAQKI
jgi:MMP 1-O-methyltransferase